MTDKKSPVSTIGLIVGGVVVLICLVAVAPTAKQRNQRAFADCSSLITDLLALLKQVNASDLRRSDQGIEKQSDLCCRFDGIVGQGVEQVDWKIFYDLVNEITDTIDAVLPLPLPQASPDNRRQVLMWRGEFEQLTKRWGIIRNFTRPVVR